MRLHSRVWRAATWIGLATCVCTVCVWILSLWCAGGIVHGHVGFALSDGDIRIFLGPLPGAVGGVEWGWRGAHFSLPHFSRIPAGSSSLWILDVPCWLLFLFNGLTTAVLWRRSFASPRGRRTSAWRTFRLGMTLISTALLVAFVWSFLISGIGYRGDTYEVQIVGGSLYIGDPSPYLKGPGLQLREMSHVSDNIWSAFASGYWLYGRVFWPRLVHIPLGLPLVLSVAVTVASFRLGRNGKRRQGGRCSGCGYDLCGNVSGVCPECGGKIVASG